VRVGTTGEPRLVKHRDHRRVGGERRDALP
jgi:hypothetical protein